jgi:hypothetical protein
MIWQTHSVAWCAEKIIHGAYHATFPDTLIKIITILNLQYNLRRKQKLEPLLASHTGGH